MEDPGRPCKARNIHTGLVLQDAGREWFVVTNTNEASHVELIFIDMAADIAHTHATGSAFWGFGDTGGAETSWNDYASKNLSDAPAVIGRRGVTDIVHWQAVREGIEDYEYLAMVQDEAERTPDVPRKTEALELMREAPAKVPKPYVGRFEWDRDPIHAQPDEYRLRMISLLESLQP